MFGLAVWAGGEAVDGVNGFRRLLGIATLVWIVSSALPDRGALRAAASQSPRLN
jgi:hypothetical protein